MSIPDHGPIDPNHCATCKIYCLEQRVKELESLGPELTWEQKLDAMCELAHCHSSSLLVPGQNDAWCCHTPGGIAGDGMICGSAFQGDTKEAAVTKQWANLQDAFRRGLHARVARPEGERRYRWGKFMWVEVSP